MENAIIENASTKMRGWNTQVRKRQVEICRDGKRKYGNGKSDLDADTYDRKISPPNDTDSALTDLETLVFSIT